MIDCLVSKYMNVYIKHRLIDSSSINITGKKSVKFICFKLYRCKYMSVMRVTDYKRRQCDCKKTCLDKFEFTH